MQWRACKQHPIKPWFFCDGFMLQSTFWKIDFVYQLLLRSHLVLTGNFDICQRSQVSCLRIYKKQPPRILPGRLHFLSLFHNPPYQPFYTIIKTDGINSFCKQAHICFDIDSPCRNKYCFYRCASCICYQQFSLFITCSEYHRNYVSYRVRKNSNAVLLAIPV